MTFIALGVWSAALLALRIPALAGAGIAVAAGVTVLLLRHKAGLAAILITTIATGIVGGAAITAAHVAIRDAGPFRELVDDHVSAQVLGTVTDDPRRLADLRDPVFVVPVDLAEVVVNGRRLVVSARAVVFATDSADHEWAQLLPGQRVTVTGTLSRPGESTDLTSARISTRQPPRLHGDPPWWQTIAGGLREGLRQACAGLPAAPAGLLPGLVVGDVSRLPTEVAEDFRDTGLTHLTAVSGSNLAMVIGAVLALAVACRAGPRTRLLIGIAVICCFVIVARPSASVLRAAVMGGISLLTLSNGRRSASAIPVLAAAVVLLLGWDPALAYDLGFALSVLATAGLVFFADRWAGGLRRRGWPPWLAMAVAVPLAAQVAVTPVLAAATGAVSAVAVPANVLVAAAVPPATILGVAATAVAPWWPAAAAGVAWLASWPTRWLIYVAHAGAQMPAGEMPWPTGWWWGLLLAAIAVVIGMVCRWRLGRRLLLIVALGIAVGVAPVRWWSGSWPPQGWVMVACDVGQGDGLVLATDDPHTAIVVDAGPDPGPIDDCLRELDIEQVALLVISHFHADHVGGIEGVFRGRRVGAVITPHNADPAAGHRRLTEAAGGVATPEVAMGSCFSVGSARLEVLSAGEGFVGTRSDPNNNSLVLRAEVAGVKLLLSGDIEQAAQQALLDSGMDLDADVLKVPHHGSGAFLPEYYRAASPAVAVISVGVGNDYGHPHPRSLRQLRRQGVKVLRTDQDGATAVVSTKEGLAVMTHTGDRDHH